MPNFKKTDLKFSYNWDCNEKIIENKKIKFNDNFSLNLEEGYEVLPFINSYMDLKNYAMLTTFHKIEHALKAELPHSKTGYCKIKRWLSENYFF